MRVGFELELYWWRSYILGTNFKSIIKIFIVTPINHLNTIGKARNNRQKCFLRFPASEVSMILEVTCCFLTIFQNANLDIPTNLINGMKINHNPVRNIVDDSP